MNRHRESFLTQRNQSSERWKTGELEKTCIVGGLFCNCQLLFIGIHITNSRIAIKCSVICNHIREAKIGCREGRQPSHPQRAVSSRSAREYGDLYCCYLCFLDRPSQIKRLLLPFTRFSSTRIADISAKGKKNNRKLFFSFYAFKQIFHLQTPWDLTYYLWRTAFCSSNIIHFVADQEDTELLSRASGHDSDKLFHLFPEWYIVTVVKHLYFNQ